MAGHWSGKFDPCCEHCMRSPEEVPGKLMPERLEEFGWVHSGFAWYCPCCEAVGREEGEELFSGEEE